MKYIHTYIHTYILYMHTFNYSYTLSVWFDKFEESRGNGGSPDRRNNKSVHLL